MKVILNNGTELDAIVVIGGKRQIQGASRDTLSFVFPAEIGMDALDAEFTASACESITIVETVVNEDNSVTENAYNHKGYTIRAELKKETLEVSPATPDAAAVTEERITVAMSQRTYQETQIKNMEAALAALAGVEV